MSGAHAAIAEVLRARSGLVVGPEKLYLLETRLAPILKRESLRDLADLAAKLRPGSPLERDVVDAMTTNESLFFRDGKPFETLRTKILPELHAKRPAGVPLRIWSAAASTGQEAYSIAMVAADLAASLDGRRVDIIGTDIARDCLNRAREGLYSQFEIQRGLPMQMLVKHFVKENQNWRIKSHLRDAVAFREWNLLSDLSALGQFEIIFCRNVLIYFDISTKKRVLAAMAKQMPKDGTLFLGSAETILGASTAFRSMPGENGVFVRG